MGQASHVLNAFPLNAQYIIAWKLEHRLDTDYITVAAYIIMDHKQSFDIELLLKHMVKNLWNLGELTAVQSK